MLRSIFYSICIIIMISCHKTVSKADYQIVPLPNSITYTNKKPFVLNNETIITYPKSDTLLKKDAQFLAQYLRELVHLSLDIVPDVQSDNCIILSSSLKHQQKEAYELHVTSTNIIINGATQAGTFYGIQTFRKSLPHSLEAGDIVFPSVSIADSPRFGYRGMHLDVSRHFFPTKFVKEYIDILALHNINYFHWHLTDDQGWRIEIKKYPKLTEVGALRSETLVGHLLKDKPHTFDGTPHGGFYTQEDIKEIVKYAQDRYITIIPEIDIPGHTLSVLAAYPELGCTGENYQVATKWGVFDDVLCAGNDQTYTFLEDIFEEITELFPSNYIHIGGDECPKTKWKSCPKCQAKIKALQLVSDGVHSPETQLQGFIVQKVEQILKKKGREIIGWDEILEGGLISRDAIVMSWRGTEGGIAAAKQHNRAIMTPHHSLYFDYNQGEDITKEPLSIGEFLPVKKVYEYEPIANELTNEQSQYILGVQANLWTEYIKTPSHLEYMLLPRLAALSEVQWTDSSRKEYSSFLSRLSQLFSIYQKEGYNFAKHLYGISSEITPTTDQKGIQITLHTVGNGKIYYTTDGTPPSEQSNCYTTPIVMSSKGTVKAIAIHKDTLSEVFEYISIFNKATYKPVQLLVEPNPKYTFAGAKALVDIKKGSSSYIDGNWVGFSGRTGMEAIIDLGESKDISSVKTSTLCDIPNWIFPASSIQIYGSENGKDYSLLAEKESKIVDEKTPIQPIPMEVSFVSKSMRYVKIILKGTIIPAWHEGKNTPALLFVDEIEVN